MSADVVAVGPAEARAVADGWSDRVTVCPLSRMPGVSALLVRRPDGYVAWAADGTPGTTSPRDALTTWFGAPHPTSTP